MNIEAHLPYDPSKSKDSLDYYIVHGSGEIKTENRKIIKCPHCKGAITMVDVDTKAELFQHPSRKKIRCQLYHVCPNCKSEIGMIFA